MFFQIYDSLLMIIMADILILMASDSDAPSGSFGSGRKDPAWKYNTLPDPKDINSLKCNFCGKITKGGVYRAKHHLVGGYRNTKVCPKCPSHVKEEIREYMSKKLEEKNNSDVILDFDDIDTLGDDDEVVFERGVKRPMSSSSSQGFTMQQKKQRMKGPLDLLLPPKPKVSTGKQTTMETHVNKELRENACVWFSRWMYEAGLSFSAVKYPIFKPMIEAIGRASPGMKPPSYHEVRVPYLKKELVHTNEIMKSHKEDWPKYGCSLMCDGWKDKRKRSLLNFLVNYPKGSMFIRSIDTSSYAKDAVKIFQLLDQFVEEVGEANVVQVVTDNASANILVGKFAIF
ncbi:uncharacterized protein LOC127813510 isoform X1 [Diospyros lotus]|uniref:uncharacterized protein LOC127813510 isoform X1 n=1 Tax=Diospyros lotus TaxID=55363 RepID=UPI0022588CB7|nr:uncharacterized protein LOC127813510 isoform X1 [Diospyros lotus]